MIAGLTKLVVLVAAFGLCTASAAAQDEDRSKAVPTDEVASDEPAVREPGPDPAVPMTERTEALELVKRMRRTEDGVRWTAGPYQGDYEQDMRGMGTLSVFGMRRRDIGAHAEVTIVGGPGFDAAPLSFVCEGGESDITFGWVGFDTADLGYACEFTRSGAPADDIDFALAVERGGIIAQLAQNNRAGELRYGDRVLRFRTQRLSGVGLPTGRVPGYVVTNEDGVEIAGMDYRVMNPMMYLPPAGSPDREAALVAVVALAFFNDPANQE